MSPIDRDDGTKGSIGLSDQAMYTVPTITHGKEWYSAVNTQKRLFEYDGLLIVSLKSYVMRWRVVPAFKFIVQLERYIALTLSSFSVSFSFFFFSGFVASPNSLVYLWLTINHVRLGNLLKIWGTWRSRQD